MPFGYWVKNFESQKVLFLKSKLVARSTTSCHSERHAMRGVKSPSDGCLPDTFAGILQPSASEWHLRNTLLAVFAIIPSTAVVCSNTKTPRYFETCSGGLHARKVNGG